MPQLTNEELDELIASLQRIKKARETNQVPPEGLSVDEAFQAFGDNDPRGNPTHPDAKFGGTLMRNEVYKSSRGLLPKPLDHGPTDAAD